MSASLAGYFEKHRPAARWLSGDRVEGKHNGIPFVGSVGAEIMRNEDEGSRVGVHLDLPITDPEDGKMKLWIRVKPSTLKSRR